MLDSMQQAACKSRGYEKSMSKSLFFSLPKMNFLEFRENKNWSDFGRNFFENHDFWCDFDCFNVFTTCFSKIGLLYIFHQPSRFGESNKLPAEFATEGIVLPAFLPGSPERVRAWAPPVPMSKRLWWGFSADWPFLNFEWNNYENWLLIYEFVDKNRLKLENNWKYLIK